MSGLFRNAEIQQQLFRGIQSITGPVLSRIYIILSTRTFIDDENCSLHFTFKIHASCLGSPSMTSASGVDSSERQESQIDKD